MAIFLIGIDDTDNETSSGTGQLARWLGQEIESEGRRCWVSRGINFCWTTESPIHRITAGRVWRLSGAVRRADWNSPST